MQSLYAKYLVERTNDLIIECEQGFATYRYLNKDQVYVIDIFILPEFRKQKYASTLANFICEEARAKGCTEMIGSVVPSCKGGNESLLTLIGYGMELSGASDNLIVFKKRI